MLESEEYCHKSDVGKERLYFATGYGLIQCVKGLMSYADEDLLSAINHTKHGNHIASQHRKKAGFFGSLMGSTASIRSMSDGERHAELTYAESLFEKALLGIVYSGDWLAFIKEACVLSLSDVDFDIDRRARLNMRTVFGLATLVELFGYKGDRTYGLDLLMRAGGWSTDRSESAAEPGVSTTHEGVRRPICDMALLIFHLVMSSYTGAGVDIVVATRILEWNLKRFPNGVFFLFGAGRLALHRSRPRLAIHYYSQAMASQIQYRNLDHISYWECAIARLALWEEIRVGGSAACWRVLEAEATWSKAIYSYGLAACFLEDWDTDSPPSTPSGTGPTPKPKTKEARMKEASNLMKRVPNIRQKIAGKSIPLEKFVARKARKYTSQANRLLLPALEIAYIFYAIAHAPRSVLSAKMLPLVRGALQKLSLGPEGYEGGKGEYWDDLCLARFLEGVCLRFIAYPDPDATPDPSSETDIIPSTEAAQGAVEAFKAVFEYGPKIELDHYIVYHAHYEYGRLLACQGDFVGAKREFELVLSGKPLEVGASGRKVQSHSLLYPFLFLFRLC
ncbi:Tetratricopeptide repeat protein 39B [Termitomyces sp. J132]|nr:Tetratricopeptide repeat protein 39B [Termitomyces sp. J132]